MTPRIRFATLLLAFFLGFPASASHAAPPEIARTLVVEGRVADATGWPIEGARISVAGRERPVAVSDENGRYTVTLFVGPISALARTPFEQTFRASLRGWTFTIPAGDPALGIAASVIHGVDGRTRLRVRSNDRWIADTVASAFLDSPAPTVRVALSFLGRKGTEAPRRAIEMGHVADRILGPDGTTFGAPVATHPAARDTTKSRTGARAAATKPSGSRATGTPTPTPASRDGAPGAGSGSSGTTAASGASGTSSSGSRSRSWRLFPSADDRYEPAPAPRRDTLASRSQPVSDPADTPVVIVSPPLSASATVTPRGTATSPSTPARVPPGTAARVPVPASGDGAGTAARAADSISIVGPASRPATTRPGSSAGATSSANVSGAPAKKAVVPPASTARTSASAARGSRTDSVRTPGGSVSVRVAPDTAERASDAPTTRRRSDNPIRVWGGRALPAGDSEPSTDDPEDCGCRVRGTIEIRSDRPLRDPLRVTVSTERARGLSDTVELFMGSPRSFELRRVPCGTQRLTFRTFGRGRWVALSNLPLESFECTSGRQRQVHLVLVPR